MFGYENNNRNIFVDAITNYIAHDCKIDINFDKYLDKVNTYKWYSVENFSYGNNLYEWYQSENVSNNFYRPIKFIIKYNSTNTDIFQYLDQFFVEINGINLLSIPFAKYIDSQCVQELIGSNGDYDRKITIDLKNNFYLKSSCKNTLLDTKLKITSKSFDKMSISMLVENISCSKEIIKKLSTVPQVFDKCDKYEIFEQSHKIFIDLYPKDGIKNEYIRGMIIKGSFNKSINLSVKMINLKINGNIFLQFDNALIELIGINISKNTLYLPFGDINVDNIYNKISYRKMESFNLEIEFDDQTQYSDLSIYIDMFQLFAYKYKHIETYCANATEFIKIIQ